MSVRVTKKHHLIGATNMLLYRPVGVKELELIQASGFREFPPRLAFQPIFYPVLTREYAVAIARDWNTKDEASGFAGFVTEFEIDDEYASGFPIQQVGAAIHRELWVPAERLAEFNRHIQGPIRVVESFFGEPPRRGSSMREPLLTDRLILRDVTVADAEMLFDLDSDAEVMRYIGPRPASDATWYRDRIRSVYLPQQAHPWHGVRIVLARANNEFLGWAFVRPAMDALYALETRWTKPGEEEVGYRFRRSAWGRGIATEAASPLVRIALEDPATTAVVARASAGNAGSLGVLEKLGLKRVGEVTLPESSEPTVKLARMK